ncbi:MAG: GAF domain-containing protein [Deltaproteobacteria bacterium]|nr:MAG: GAF domain-containing protein [Deltaproteobacteria bacterium]
MENLRNLIVLPFLNTFAGDGEGTLRVDVTAEDGEHQIKYEGKVVGSLKIDEGFRIDTIHLSELSKRVAPILAAGKDLIEYQLKVLDWVAEAKDIAGDAGDWVGVYYKASYILKEDTTDLVLGPYLGRSTDHIRIPIDKGFCGMALREEKTVNIEDVSKDDTHIACSITTKSEIVIPLKDSNGNFVAELDIDSDKLASFNPKLEAELQEFALTFPSL